MRKVRQKTNDTLLSVRPEIYKHHDYRAFLEEWFGYLRKEDPDFSLRGIAKKSHLSCAYLPQVLKGTRKLSLRALEKLSPWLKLRDEELAYLSSLRSLSDGDTQAVRQAAIRKLQKFSGYQMLNSKELEVFRYLSRWYYVVIREMATLPGFVPDPAWITAKLDGKVSLAEARDALKFLTENNYLKVGKGNTVTQTKKELDCMAGVFRLGLTEFHHDMLQVSTDIFATEPKSPRRIEGYTMAFSRSKLDQVSTIINEAIDRVQALGQEENSPDSVYHVTFMAVPLTVSAKERKKS